MGERDEVGQRVEGQGGDGVDLLAGEGLTVVHQPRLGLLQGVRAGHRVESVEARSTAKPGPVCTGAAAGSSSRETGGGGEPAGWPRADEVGPRNVRTPQGAVLGNTQSG